MTITPLEVQCPDVVEAGTMPTTQTSQTPAAACGAAIPVDLAALLDDEAMAALAAAARALAATAA